MRNRRGSFLPQRKSTLYIKQRATCASLSLALPVVACLLVPQVNALSLTNGVALISAAVLKDSQRHETRIALHWGSRTLDQNRTHVGECAKESCHRLAKS